MDEGAKLSGCTGRSPDAARNAPYFRTVRLLSILFLLLVTVSRGQAQTDPTENGMPLVLEETISLGLSQARIMQAIDSLWPYTFGQEPGAILKHINASTGTVQGAARFNYRSTQLMAREETMGSVAYQITMQVTNGQCKVVVAGFTHTGNRGAPTGGIHLGPIYRGDRPRDRVQGIGIGSARTIHADIRDQSRDRIMVVVRSFATRLRQVQAR